MVAVPAFLLSFGSNTPLLAFVHSAGLLPSIRYPEKFVLSASFALLVYAAVVLDAILRGNAMLARRAAWICGVCGAIAAALFLICLQPGYAAWFRHFWPGGEAAGAASIARTQWLVAALRGAAFAFALGVLVRDTGRKAVSLLVLFLVADLAPLSNQINPRIDRNFFDEPPPIVKKLDRGGSRLANVAAIQLNSKEAKLYFQAIRTYWVLKNGVWPYMAALWGVPSCIEYDVDETQLVKTREFFEMIDDLAKRGVRSWMVVIGPMYGSGQALTFRDPEPELKRIGDDWARIEPVEIEELPRYPRYFFASEMVDTANVASLTDLLVARRWDPRTAFVRSGARPVSPGTIVASHETGNRTIIDVVTEGEAFLVLASTNHKYWRATIDGEPAPIIATNLAFQGIEVAKGSHRVELNYRNPLIAVGGLLSALALSCLIFVRRRSGIGSAWK